MTGARSGSFALLETQAVVSADATDPGAAMHALIAELYPICRSMTGDGVRETLSRIGRHAPVQVSEVPSGTQVLDWTVPPEWNIRDAYIKVASGNKLVDFGNHSLHVVSYSVPVRATLSYEELRPHLHTLPDQPDRIPYRTAYWDRTWGFCLSQRQLERLGDGPFEVVIDSTLREGSLTYGEIVVPGRSSDEILLAAHCCHPSLCNDNLSGIAVAVWTALAAMQRPLRHTLRVLLAPVTIGAVTWLARNEDAVGRIRHGLTLSNLGDPGALTYKRSRRGAAPIDRAAANVLAAHPHQLVDFVPYGYDERQFCSPGFDLPVGGLSRTPWQQYPEYHTSADDLSFVTPAALADSLARCLEILAVVDGDEQLLNLSPKGEPQLGRRGLYGRRIGDHDPAASNLALLWVLNLSDGTHSLLDIAERARLPFALVRAASDLLLDAGLVARAGAGA